MPPRNCTDEDLVNAFVASTSGYSLREAGELAGVSHGTVDRWRKGQIGELKPATRRALEDYLALHVPDDHTERLAKLIAANRLEELAAQLRREAAEGGGVSRAQAGADAVGLLEEVDEHLGRRPDQPEPRQARDARRRSG